MSTEELELDDDLQAAVTLLTEEPGLIYEAWDQTDSASGGVLFQRVTPDGRCRKNPDDQYCGCLTQIHNTKMIAWTPELTQMIRDDDRIPNNGDDVAVSDLEVFAEWQQRIRNYFKEHPPAGG